MLVSCPTHAGLVVRRAGDKVTAFLFFSRLSSTPPALSPLSITSFSIFHIEAPPLVLSAAVSPSSLVLPVSLQCQLRRPRSSMANNGAQTQHPDSVPESTHGGSSDSAASAPPKPTRYAYDASP